MPLIQVGGYPPGMMMSGYPPGMMSSYPPGMMMSNQHPLFPRQNPIMIGVHPSMLLGQNSIVVGVQIPTCKNCNRPRKNGKDANGHWFQFCQGNQCCRHSSHPSMLLSLNSITVGVSVPTCKQCNQPRKNGKNSNGYWFKFCQGNSCSQQSSSNFRPRSRLDEMGVPRPYPSKHY